ncbi:hypothetical protein THAOC_16864 [Thalassiosira oceanica]|uniref:HMG box domain-containing protein n=1 Tax=Thalassiosira oceanica TaxID=159749 RepID=K0SB38_THAOC|nr:hypothetical protein THAOC_16864 [Thalassiosira oceanica]|eukprot:EJK62520.1 hypothetical protein THAOC_16864 [Thalassiosira oceanica]
MSPPGEESTVEDRQAGEDMAVDGDTAAAASEAPARPPPASQVESAAAVEGEPSSSADAAADGDADVKSKDRGDGEANASKDAAAEADGDANDNDKSKDRGVEVESSKCEKIDDAKTETPEEPAEDPKTKADEGGGSGGQKRPAEDDLGPLPELPLKRARTAYFIFADEKRDDVKKENPGGGVAVVAKAIGQLWSALEAPEKLKYENAAAEERARVARDAQRLKDAGLWPEKGAEVAQALDEDALAFPVGRIRKICKLDPEVKGMSKEATLLITKSVELFCHRLGMECVTMAQMSNRRKLLPDDIVQVASMKERFMFMKSDLVDLHKAQLQEAKEKEADSKRGKKKGGDEPSGPSIMSFFDKPS